MTTENTESSTFTCMTPVGYRMIVKERRVENKTKGGIILAQETQDAEQYATMVGKVVAMGDGCYQHESYNDQAWCKLGDDIMFNKHAGYRLDVRENGELVRYRILKDNDVIGNVHEPDVIRFYM